MKIFVRSIFSFYARGSVDEDGVFLIFLYFNVIFRTISDGSRIYIPKLPIHAAGT
jgi:hypothetical protein